jgi:hypothetical protein
VDIDGLDPVGRKPIVFLPFVQNNLHRADPDGQQPKADGIDPPGLADWMYGASLTKRTL